MKNAQCKKCLNKFHEKDIYTIQQVQYRKKHTQKWTINFFKKLKIDEWNSYCESVIMVYSKKSNDTWKKSKV